MAIVLKGRELVATDALSEGELTILLSLAARRPLTINGRTLEARDIERLAEEATRSGRPVWLPFANDADGGGEKDAAHPPLQTIGATPRAAVDTNDADATGGRDSADQMHELSHRATDAPDVSPQQQSAATTSDASHAHREKVLSHAATRLSGLDHLTDPEEIAAAFRNFLKIEDGRLRMAHRFGAEGRWTAEARSFVIDRVVERAFRAAAWPGEGGEFLGRAKNGCAVVALGGYGRNELAPFSDIDLLFLHTGRRAAQMRQLIERVLRLLWDSGLTVGHSFRTAQECVTAARTDPHLQTALVTTRLIAGNGALFDLLQSALERERRKRSDAFLATVKAARDERYQRYGAAIYLQEPNVKESAGGLRDLHTALWIGHSKFGCQTLAELCAHDVISAEEQRRAERAYDFLLRVRYEAHLETNRKTDRLALDIQPQIAARFGYASEPHLLASEKFMRDYYRRARELNQFSEAVFGRATERNQQRSRWFNWQRAAARLAEPFSISEGRLQLEADPGVFKKNPLLLFEAFALAQAADVPLSHHLKEAVTRCLRAVNKSFCASAEASAEFCKILRRRGRVGRALRAMHEVGFLDRFLPEFARISLLIQHDLYHHYTVDEHTLRAIDALDELHAGQDKQRQHLRAAFDDLRDPALLYLSVLLHDIGKGQGSGHVARGVEISARVCERLQLGERDAAQVLAMVKYHTVMAQISQRRDLREPQVAADFAAQMNSVDSLKMLLLLTYADLNAVGPGVWSDWKGSLLWELYERAHAVLRGEDAHPDSAGKGEEARLARLKDESIKALGGEALPSEIERHFALLPDRYARAVRAADVADHLRLVKKLEKEIVSVSWRQRGKAATALTICTLDRHGLFADLAGTLTAQGVEILGVELNTREDGVAIDVFTIRETATHHALPDYKWPKIEEALLAAVKGETDVAALVERWRTKNAPRRSRPVSSRAKREPQIVGDNEVAGQATVFEVRAADEPGLAYKIASALVALNLDIVCARITTEKSDALDVFYVTDAAGAKLKDEALRSVEVDLARRLAPRHHAASGVNSVDPATPNTHHSKETIE